MSKRLDNYIKTYKQNNDNPPKNSNEIIKFRDNLNENIPSHPGQHEMINTRTLKEIKALIGEAQEVPN